MKQRLSLRLEVQERLLDYLSKQNPHLVAILCVQAELAMLKEFEEATPLPGEGAAVR